MDFVLLIIISVLLAAEIGVLVYAWLRRRTVFQNYGFIAFSSSLVLLTAVQLLPSTWAMGDQVNRSVIVWLALSACLASYGALVLIDNVESEKLGQRLRLGAGIAGAWFGIFLLTALFVQPPFTGWIHWLNEFPLVTALVGIIGALALAAYILGISFRYFYLAPMPEVANRYAFWIVTTILVVVGLALVASAESLLMLLGTLLVLAAFGLVLYGLGHHRIIDMRDSLLIFARLLAVVVSSWTLIFGTLYFLNRFRFFDTLNLPNEDMLTLAIAALALALAVLIVPSHQISNFVFQRLMKRKRPKLSLAAAEYSQRVARAASLEEVVTATTETLNQVMGVQHSALILINNTFRVQNAVELIVLERGTNLTNPSATGYMSKDSPIFKTLAIQKVALGQFDIEYGQVYQSADAKEAEFFKSLRMGVYVPVLADGRLIGLLASGTKISDTPYFREDVELLSVIAQQVGTALRSARLIDDLQHLNDSMRVLNKRLEGAKQELEKLDTIKSDFITIASHELRTPLAQIRGYTDIIDSLSEAAGVNKQQIAPMINNLRRSTERMEELISAMLDVSQIDVNSMDLRFVRTTPEIIVKMALEPLRDPASQRGITIERQLQAGMPQVDADLQRMTQALRNIALNAIKFTPDGGRIDISAEFAPATSENDVDAILFTISDTGVGIAEKDLKFIFQKFYRGFDTQLHSTGIYKFMGAGPGLGLTIAKGIIEGHGGQIWVESPGHSMTEPMGSTFYVKLPIVPPQGTRRVLPFEAEGEKRSTNEIQQVGL